MSLSARELVLSIGRARLIDNVSLSLEPGQVTAVLGPNGAGKSSLLRGLTNEWAPTSGEVALNGRLVEQWPARELATTLAVLPQHSTLNFAFTALEVVLLGRTPHASGFTRDREIAQSALALVDGGDLGQRLYTELSGGEKQRIHLARVLAQIWEEGRFGPRFLLLDEPTSSFDLKHQQMLLDILKQFASTGCGVLVVLHDLNLAARVADTMIMLRSGRIAASGPPSMVMRAEIIRDVFGVEVLIGVHPYAATPMVMLAGGDRL